MSTCIWYTNYRGDKMSAHRLFQIINILLAKKNVTAGELSEKFEVSIRTIYRDIDVLSAAGVPIYATQGRGGGISLFDNYVLDKSLLSSSEQEQILMALKNISLASPDIDVLLIKLSALFQRPTIDWMEVDLSQWGNAAQDTQLFELLRAGILQKRIITFCYVDSSGKKSTKTIKPAKLVFKSKFWYLQAFCMDSQEYRTYKLNRINTITLNADHFVDTLAPPPIEDPLHAQSSCPLSLKFDKSIQHRVYDEFDECTITLDTDDNLIVTIEMPENDWLYGYLLSFGSALNVLEPHHIRHILKNKALGILNIYKTLG